MVTFALIFVYTAEVYPTTVRSTGLGYQFNYLLKLSLDPSLSYFVPLRSISGHFRILNG